MEVRVYPVVRLPSQLVHWSPPSVQANDIGCHIITATNDVIAKLALVGKDLDEYSLETVKMFRKDAVAAGYAIKIADVAA